MVLEVFRLAAERTNHIFFRNITFSLEAGQWCWVTGPNGCGKTTLLKMLAGFIPLEGGYDYQTARNTAASLQWKGKKISRFDPMFLQDLLYLGHRPALHPALSPVENLSWLFSLHSKLSPDSELLITALIRMGLRSSDIHRATGELSFGQQQRVSLARIAVVKTSLWILDEPSTGLDEKGHTILQTYLHQHLMQGGLAIIASHASLDKVQPPQHCINLQSSLCDTRS